jgi:hypothetical protein
LIENGDMITIDCANHRIDTHVSQEVMQVLTYVGTINTYVYPASFPLCILCVVFTPTFRTQTNPKHNPGPKEEMDATPTTSDEGHAVQVHQKRQFSVGRLCDGPVMMHTSFVIVTWCTNTNTSATHYDVR